MSSVLSLIAGRTYGIGTYNRYPTAFGMFKDWIDYTPFVVLLAIVVFLIWPKK